MYVYEDVFTEEEADALIARGVPHLTKAETMGFFGEKHSDERRAKHARDADVTGLHPLKQDDPDDIVRVFRERMANAALFPEDHGEVLQVTRYLKGQKYEIHFDSSLVAGRAVTVVAFLRAPKQGGELMFPWAKRGRFANVTLPGLRGKGRPLTELEGKNEEPPAGPLCEPDSNAMAISPRVGRLAVWFNHDPQLRRVGYEAMHASCVFFCGGSLRRRRKGRERGTDAHDDVIRRCPVKSDDAKFIAQLWLKWHRPNEQNQIEEIMRSVGLRWLLPFIS